MKKHRSNQMIENMFADFKSGRTCTDDAPRPDRPKEVAVLKNI